MSKSIKALSFTLILVLMLALCAAPAFASTYDNCADSLNELGLFQGTGTGYALDQAPTRAQAAVMLVRLLGQEETAKRGEYSHPFTDVPEWAEPHIAYMYETGLTKGASATTFDSEGLCNAQMYYTFVLRALGYSEDEKDFTYANAAKFAGEKSLISFAADASFLRDQLVAISYNALALPLKGATTTLLDKLVEDKAVDAAKAKPYQDTFAAYANFLKADAVSAATNAVSMDYDITMAMTQDGEKIDMTATGKIAMIIDEANPEKTAFSIVLKLTTKDPKEDDIALSVCLVDGVVYADMDGEKIKIAVPLADLGDFSFDLDTATLNQANNICTIRSAKQTGNEYEIVFDMDMIYSSILPLMDEIFSQIAAIDPTLEGVYESIGYQFGTATLVCKYDNNNNLLSMGMKFTASATVEDEKMTMNIDMTVDNIVSGAKVVVEKPKDADSYIDYDAYLDEFLKELDAA